MELLGEGQSGYSNFFCTSKTWGGGGGRGGALKNTLYKNMSFARAGLDMDGMTGLVMTGMAPGMAGGFMPGIFYARGNYDGGSGDAGVSEK